MINLEYAEVTWELNGHCKLQCSYCQPQWKTGHLDKTIDQYLAVVDKLQNTRYSHHSKIYWKIGGGEPLHFPHLNTLLKKMKERPSVIRLDTSGDDTYFASYGILNFIDKIKLTYHSWQNDDVFGFILEQCQEKSIEVSIVVPLTPGLINECRQRVEHFKSIGYRCTEQILYNTNGELYWGYSNIDLNRIEGRPDDWAEEPVVYDPNQPDPRYVDLSVINDTDPVYTGQPCYAGVDWIHINSKGFASYSQCGGRSEHYNAFDSNWQPPSNHFPCNVGQCRSEQDRRKIRIVAN